MCVCMRACLCVCMYVCHTQTQRKTRPTHLYLLIHKVSVQRIGVVEVVHASLLKTFVGYILCSVCVCVCVCMCAGVWVCVSVRVSSCASVRHPSIHPSTLLPVHTYSRSLTARACFRQRPIQVQYSHHCQHINHVYTHALAYSCTPFYTQHAHVLCNNYRATNRTLWVPMHP